MMKVQEVLLRAKAKKISWWQAAEIIGIRARSVRRWRERLEQDGYDGLADRGRGRVSPKRVPLANAFGTSKLAWWRYPQTNCDALSSVF